MRTVYVDVLVAVNLLIDCMLLMSVGRLLRLQTKPWRIILGGAVGGACSLAALLPKLPSALTAALDLIFAALMILATFGRTSPKRFLIRTSALFAASFSFCGIMLFVCTIFKPKGIAVINDVVYFNISPIWLILLSLLCFYALKLFGRLTHKTAAKRVCTVQARLGNDTAEFTALVDTGCHVTEPFSGDAVIIAEKALLKDIPLLNFQIRIIPFESLGGSGALEGIPAKEISIDGKALPERVYIGLCDGVLRGDVKAIVPSEILRER